MRVWKKNEKYHGYQSPDTQKEKMTKVKLKLNIIPRMNWKES